MKTQERVKEAKEYRKKYKQNAIKMKQEQALKNQKKENEKGEKRVEGIGRGLWGNTKQHKQEWIYSLTK